MDPQKTLLQRAVSAKFEHTHVGRLAIYMGSIKFVRNSLICGLHERVFFLTRSNSWTAFVGVCLTQGMEGEGRLCRFHIGFPTQV